MDSRGTSSPGLISLCTLAGPGALPRVDGNGETLKSDPHVAGIALVGPGDSAGIAVDEIAIDSSEARLAALGR
jgi:hypothetical protein